MSFNNHLKSEGIYVVNPQAQKRNITKPNQVLSVEGLKKALRYVYLYAHPCSLSSSVGLAIQNFLWLHSSYRYACVQTNLTHSHK